MASELLKHGERSNDSKGVCESLSARIFQCARCYALTKICTHCDRWNIYAITIQLRILLQVHWRAGWIYCLAG